MAGIIDILRLIRVVNCLLAMVAVAVGSYMTEQTGAYYGPMVSALAVFFVCAAGNILNDIRDIEIDRINRPYRVLVRRGIEVKTAWYLFAVCSVLSLLFAVSVNYQVFVLVIIASLALAVYNLGLKRVPVVGNILIATLAGLTFLAGGWATDPDLVLALPGPLIPALFAFLIHLDREILKDIQDIEGDRLAGVKTLPMIIGNSASLLTILGIFVLLVIATIYPILAGWYGDMYKTISLYAIDLPMTALLIVVWGFPTPKLLSAVSVALKIVMALGLVALITA